MAETSEMIAMQNDVLDGLRGMMVAVQRHGLPEKTLAYMLLELSKEAAMQAEPQELFDHTLMMEARGKELRAEFIARFGEMLDAEALARGEVVIKH